MSKVKAKAPRVFVPLTKVDEDQRLIYGTITAEEQDQAGETMDYTKSKPNFEKWSNDIHTASGGLSKGNLRVMHGLNVAGKLTELEFNDDDQSIEVCAKIVDDSEWEKVLEGCYTGFSVGGRYGKKWTEDADGGKIKKFEAIPNEVSIVDNPCVKSATFSLIKADGTEEEVEFDLPDDVLAKLKTDPSTKEAAEGQEEANEETSDTNGEQDIAEEPDLTPIGKAENDKKIKVVNPPANKADYVPSNPEVAKKAEALCKAAGTGDWMDYLEPARAELIKEFTAKDEKADDDEGKAPKGKGKGDKDKKAAKPADKSADEEDTKVEKSDFAVANRLTQGWNTSDGKFFAKKADAEAHEATIEPEPQDEADALAARLKKAIEGAAEPAAVDIFSLDRIDDLHKAVLELDLPRDEGSIEPKLEKGMYTVSRFASMLGDVAGLARTIKTEGVLEAGDSEDENVAKILQTQLDAFGTSFMTYAKQQVAELVAGLDVDLAPRACYDYYYRAAGEGNDLAKTVVEVIAAVEDEMEAVTESMEELAKSFGFVSGTLESTDDDLSPPMQKRFDEQEAKLAKVTKVAEDAVAAVETLTKRVGELEDEPLPRAPGHVMLKEGDGSFLGKRASSNEEKMEVLQGLVAEHGVDGLATMLIKASQATGGVRMGMRS